MILEKNDKIKILVTFAGMSDPIRGVHDGPFLHICRVQKPEKIYLILVGNKFRKRHNEMDLYRKAIDECIDNYKCEIEKVELDIKEGEIHYYNSYNEDIEKLFNTIRETYKGTDYEILMNLSSGAPQMTGNLINYYVINPSKITPVQVESPEGDTNSTPPYEFEGDKKEENKKEENKKDVLRDAINNNNDRKNKENIKNRVLYPDLKVYTRSALKLQIKELIKKYEYETILQLLQNVYDTNDELITLLKYAIDRKNLKGESANKKLDLINKNSKYNNIYYFNSKKKQKQINEPNIEQWHKIVDYYSLAKIKATVNDISSYILMIEPLNFYIYFSILIHIIGQKFNKLFIKENKRYKYNKKNTVISNQFKCKLKGYVQTMGLKQIISYYIDHNSSIGQKISEVDFETLCECFESIKPIRNELAHTFSRIDQDGVKNKSTFTINDLNIQIEGFFSKYYKEYGYNQDMVNVYSNINKHIIDLLDRGDIDN